MAGRKTKRRGKRPTAAGAAASRRPENRHRKEGLTLSRILVWADAHYHRTGQWPTQTSGPVHGVAGETWGAIDRALRHGYRELPGGSGLATVLGTFRGYTPPRPPLTLRQILAWANAHQERTGKWPTRTSGLVHGVQGETWAAIDIALKRGRRGFPGGSSLSRLVAEHCGIGPYLLKPPLTIAQILNWADAHHRSTGKWPTQQSRAVHDVPGESWSAINASLRCGWRGLPGGSSLPELLAEHRGVPAYEAPPLTIEQILAWADAHHEHTGRWPDSSCRTVSIAPGLTWGAINGALQRGHRGFPGGSSLVKLLSERRGYRRRPSLSIPQILTWADAFHERTGKWPTERSGPVDDVVGENWVSIDLALHCGHRGLPGGSSLARLLIEHRGKRPFHIRTPLSVTQILKWAQEHHERTGKWPRSNSGPVHGVDRETWRTIDCCLHKGFRGLPGGTTLAKLLAKHRSKSPGARKRKR